ncbi:MAG TPA: PilZ domain-containing protein [bacterium]|nr:PilZ domain-containing protein [bacterium]
MTQVAERRSHPRVAVSLDFNIKSGEQLLAASTINLSAKGLSCMLSHHIPLFTKLGIFLMLPEPEDRSHEKIGPINCDGVVVRVDKVAKQGEERYSTAVFFTQIDKDAVERIQHYLQPYK